MMPNHAVWNELENYFGTRISAHEKQTIVELINGAMTENPDADLNELTLQATSLVIKKRR